jgi:hypothetical protein
MKMVTINDLAQKDPPKKLSGTLPVPRYPLPANRYQYGGGDTN